MAEKTVGIVINEVKTKIANIISESNLHPSIMKMILQELYDDLRNVEQQVLEKEYKQYQDAVNTVTMHDESQTKTKGKEDK